MMQGHINILVHCSKTLMYIQPLMIRASNPCAKWSYKFEQLPSRPECCEHKMLTHLAVTVNFSKSMQILAATSITKFGASVPCNPAEQTPTLGLLFLFCLKNSEKALPNLPRFLAGINTLPDSGLLVISNDRCSLLMIGDQSLLQGFSIVVGPLNQWLASDIILHVLFGWVEDLVV